LTHDLKSNRQLHILLAEDNPVNQKVAARILEKCGHAVTIVGNGRQAITALEHEHFDLVLMDVQMPEMGGLEATAAIRARDQTSGLHTIVIAMTAHAMKGDRERCLEAGMDSYIAKPIRASELVELVESSVNSPSAAVPKLENSLINVAALRKRAGGDMQLVREMVRLFFDQLPRLLSTLHTALTSRQLPEVERTAHTIRGMVSNFSSEGAALCAAEQLESGARSGNLHNAEEHLTDLEAELERLSAALRAFR
jgi:two-component system, sensor histidine kinase and response regulator